MHISSSLPPNRPYITVKAAGSRLPHKVRRRRWIVVRRQRCFLIATEPRSKRRSDARVILCLLPRALVDLNYESVVDNSRLIVLNARRSNICPFQRTYVTVLRNSLSLTIKARMNRLLTLLASANWLLRGSVYRLSTGKRVVKYLQANVTRRRTLIAHTLLILAIPRRTAVSIYALLVSNTRRTTQQPIRIMLALNVPCLTCYSSNSDLRISVYL